ncbi:MAG: hypothetical protein GY832_31550 [Chloroflexi bacterium]|nr:hypothetical protein [Chloroflexota bacterium]
MSKATEVFREELGRIKNDTVRDFVVRVIDTMAPDYFWTCPASTSGKYHPQISLGEGGLIRHTKLAVWWGAELMRMDDWTDDTHDAVIAALLLHDLKKNGDKLVNGRPTVKNCVNVHGTNLAAEMRMRMFPPGTSIPPLIDMVLDGIAYHMGRWTCPNWKTSPPESKEWGDTRLRKVVHMADYCASRRVDVKAMELKHAAL